MEDHTEDKTHKEIKIRIKMEVHKCLEVLSDKPLCIVQVLVMEDQIDNKVKEERRLMKKPKEEDSNVINNKRKGIITLTP